MDEFSQAAEQVADSFDSEAVLSAIEGVTDRVEVMDGRLNNIADTLSAASATDIDYSGHLEQIAQLLALADVLLLIVGVVLFLIAGLVFGNALTRWLRSNA